jgi:glucose/arabinose dehydrogenase
MSTPDDSTRTLLLSNKQPGTLIVSRGSESDTDTSAEQLNSGHSQIRSFDVGSLSSNAAAYEFTDGKVLGWGLRNSVGVGEHPVTGGIWSVENSVDVLIRDGKDIHQNNPAEELNFHGFLNGTTENQGGNYGYPLCYTIWDTKGFPQLGSLKIGDQFPSSEAAKTLTDQDCNTEYVDPRLAFQAHSAPLDIKFTTDGTTAYVTFHGSCE